jgi:hypothetical protein
MARAPGAALMCADQFEGEGIVSSAEQSVRHRRHYTDRAISQAYRRLGADRRSRSTFERLLGCVRIRAPRLLDAPPLDGRHAGVEALINLARFAEAHVREPASWTGSTASWRGAVRSLAQHLAGRYPVPGFLSAAWYATDDRYAEAKREWFVAHGGGACFRSLTLPIRVTSRMEHILLASHDHVGIEYALRRAELLGLGAAPTLVDAVLATRPALELDHGDFWRTVWRFLIAGSASIDIAQVGPIIDFVHAVRHERVPTPTAAGLVMRDPPQPQFSMWGRTPRSVLRLMHAWHRELSLIEGGLRWAPSQRRPMVVETVPEDPSAPPTAWELIELTNSTQLRAEGAALQHCVASYSHRCWRGATRIWSLRRRREQEVRSIVTVEVNEARRTIVQARGFRNRRASGRILQLVQTWANREGLRVESV